MHCELCGEILALIAEATFRENNRGQLRAYCLSCAEELAAINAELERENEQLHLENEELRDSIHFHITKGNG